ncbi:MAG TPA: hypothetical protein VD766_00660 [Solirubrobacterales bacterium]|nr:hypothetical protein [Solirubrobacterales bacterium]
MRFREVAQTFGVRRVCAAAVGCAVVVGVAGCGEDDFENDPRPPSPVELTAAIDKDSVSIAPSNPDAGIVVITISNQSQEPTELVLTGPTDESSAEIPPSGTGTIKAALEEGDYEASTGSSDSEVKPARLTVGPPGESSQNDLLLP